MVSHPKRVTSFSLNFADELARVSLVDRSRSDIVREEISKIQVKFSNQVIIRRYVMVNRTTVYGKNDKGWVVLERDGGSLVACITQDYARRNALPSGPLSEQLKSILEFPRNRVGLLVMVLGTEDEDAIEYLLEKENVTIPSRHPAATDAIDDKDSSDGDVEAESVGLQDSEISGDTASSDRPIEEPKAKPKTVSRNLSMKGCLKHETSSET